MEVIVLLKIYQNEQLTEHTLKLILNLVLVVAKRKIVAVGYLQNGQVKLLKGHGVGIELLIKVLDIK